MNLFYYSALAGLIGAAFTNGATYGFRFIGVKTSLPWEIAANVFLNPRFIYTPAGVVIGLAGTIALSTGIAIMIGYLLRWTGYNRAWLKGMICADAFGFITLGLAVNLFNIWPQLRNEPGTNLVALAVLSSLGMIQALLFQRWQRNLVWK
ncbi:hypothetical protein EDC14_102657 [Hydrogenispora ethanolica]|uniref:Uncharacterized protein n=1 Tax=Hydrogenispora ethanolica TaxID=1082276 RepID=A0A4R1R9C6_HYDET|nr:hypothetical protein [Hydrogenispora ethanolica]TCL62313.1 hypothetical protein EDC14_102657 [Hydrogenispora ethanolica]